MTKPQKSAHVQDLETKLTNDDERVPAMDSELQTTYSLYNWCDG